MDHAVPNGRIENGKKANDHVRSQGKQIDRTSPRQSAMKNRWGHHQLARSLPSRHRPGPRGFQGAGPSRGAWGESEGARTHELTTKRCDPSRRRVPEQLPQNTC